MKDFKIEKFENGATIILKPIKNIKFTAINMGFKTGAYFDEVKGTAHFLEHNLFLGTETRTRDEIDRDELENCSLNAATSLYYTVLRFKRANSELDRAMQSASDILLKTKFNNAEMKKEREVVRNEILSVVERDKRNVFAYHNTLWSPYLNDNCCAIVGKDIDKVTRKDLENYRNKNYIAENFIMVVASSLPMSKIVGYYKKYIEPNLKVNKKATPINYEMTPKKPSKMQVISLDQNKVDVAISINIPFGINNYKNRIARPILAYYLSAEQPYTNLRKKGLVYACSTSIAEFAYNSLVIIKFTCSKENVNKIIDEYTKELHNLYKNGMEQSKFDNICKQLIIAEDEKEHDFLEYQVNECTYFYCVNALTEELNIRKEMKKIKLQDINKYISLLNNPKNEIYVTVLGNIKDNEVYNLEQIQKKFFVNIK